MTARVVPLNPWLRGGLESQPLPSKSYYNTFLALDKGVTILFNDSGRLTLIKKMLSQV
jgi:hypothetical protein